MSTMVEKLMGGTAGSIVTFAPDYVLLNDGVSEAAVKEIKVVADPAKVLVIYDHDVPTGRPEAAGILRQNLRFAGQFGCKYIQAQGIGYQYLLNEVVKPGQIIIGGGTHGGIFGAQGALGLNVSIPELARCVETGRYSTVVPRTVYVNLTGQLPEGVSVMDAAFTLLAGALQEVEGQAVEIYAPQLDKAQQAVLCSMAGLTGAAAVLMTGELPAPAVLAAAPNAATSAAAKGAGAESPAAAPQVRSLDLSRVKPMVMHPCGERKEQGTARITTLAGLKGTEFQAGQVGGYTGGTLQALRRAADFLAGKKLARGFRLTICPATSRDYLQALDEGLITRFIDYGAQISAAGDHSVVVQGAGAMGHGEKLLTTGLYTFSGAMGCSDAQVYAASVEAVLAASVTKRI